MNFKTIPIKDHGISQDNFDDNFKEFEAQYQGFILIGGKRSYIPTISAFLIEVNNGNIQPKIKKRVHQKNSGSSSGSGNPNPNNGKHGTDTVLDRTTETLARSEGCKKRTNQDNK